jgi:poly-gamma-glutamate capsule biosynthesis protein CapA/YwtB (metallophosphatase superfamily)
VVRVFTFLALILLVAQVSTLRPDFVVPTFSYGTSEAREVAAPVVFSAREELATLAAVGEKSNTILFVGDVLLARHVETLMQREGDAYPYQGITFATFAPDPYVFGNFESAIVRDHKKTANGGMVFSVDQAFLPALKNAGFSHLGLANNHTLDYGETEFRNTVATLTDAELTPFGNPAALSHESVTFLTTSKQEIAVIAIHALRPLRSDDIVAVLDYATSRSDLQIVYVHWGEEYEITHNAAQQALAERLVAAGADLIIGHHPHVVQDIGVIDGVPVLYSIGNYIFDQYKSRETEEGLLVQLDMTAEPLVYLTPVTSLASPSQPRVMKTREGQRFLTDLASRSTPELAEVIEKGVIPLSTMVASSPKIAMIQP